MSISVQAASQSVLTVTRSCLACSPAGGQNQNVPRPSYEGDQLPLGKEETAGIAEHGDFRPYATVIEKLANR
jgi:hypothetical protein